MDDGGHDVDAGGRDHDGDCNGSARHTPLRDG